MDNNVNYTVTANDLLSGKLQGMNAQAQSLEGTMGGLQGAITAAFSIYAITSFVSSVVSAGTTVENATTGLTTLLGDSAEAARVVRNEMEDAQKTPFAFEGLLAANKTLIGAGIGADRARQDVLNLANAIAATGGGDDELKRMVVNMQQISNTGKATAQDIKQFAYAGVNIYKVLADATGKPISQVKEMEVSYDLLTMALAKAHEKGGMYYNGLENMAGNTSVRISNVGDAIFQFMNDIFVSSKPLIDGVLNSVLGLISGVRDLVGWFKEHKNVTEFLGVAIAGATSAIVLYTTATKLASFWTFLTTSSMVAQLFTAGALTAGFTGASAAGMVLAGVMAVLNSVNPVVWIIAGIAILTAGVVMLYNHFGKVRASIWALWAVIKEFFYLAKDVFLALSDIVIGVFMLDLGQIQKGFEEAALIALTAGQRVGKAASDGYTAGMKDFSHDDVMQKSLASVEKINETIAKGTTDAGMYARNVAKITDFMNKKVGEGLISEDEKTKTLGKIGKFGLKTGGGGIPPIIPTKEKSKADGVSGTKVVNINVSIGNLINDFSIKTTNLQESTTAIKEKVIQALTGAINDSQIIAGQ